MAPLSWATAEQQKFLLENLEEFIESQSTGKLSVFWSKIQRLWYQQWPEAGMEGGPSADISQDVGELIKGRNKQLQNWYYNNRNVKFRARGQARPKPFSLAVKSERSLTAVQLYSNRNYEIGIKPSVMAEIKEKNVLKEQVLGVIKRQTAEKFASEPIEVQRQFIEEANTLKRKRLEERDKSSKKRVSEPDLESYAAEINELPTLLQSIMSELGKRTGWAFMVLAGGPDPSTGKLRTVGAYEGRDMQGQTFAKAHPKFEDEVIKPFASFIKQAFPQAVRQARIATHEESTPTDSGINGGSSDVAEIASIVATASQTRFLQSVSVAGIQHHDSDRLVVIAEPPTHGAEQDSDEGERNNGSDRHWTGRLDPSLRLPATITSDAAGGVRSPTPPDGSETDWISRLDPSLRPPTDASDNGVRRSSTPPVTITQTAPGSCTPAPGAPPTSDTSQSREPAPHPGEPSHQINPRSQRQRRPAASKEIVPLTSRTARTTVTAPLVSDSSIWVQRSHKCLIEGAYGFNWSQCVDAWLEFERNLSLAEFSANRLPAIQSRPKELTQWLIKRNPSIPPQISDIKQYSATLMAWWTAMQAGTKRNAGRSLQQLHKGGPNGIVTFLFGLWWWRHNLNENEPELAEWDIIVHQVTEILQNFVNN